jgi:hypothetical protein
LRRRLRTAIGRPFRAFFRLQTADLPSSTHEGINLVVIRTDTQAAHNVFFERTANALYTLRDRAPDVYEVLREDVEAIVLVSPPVEQPYNAFQRAIAVTSDVALMVERVEYSAWLAYVSGLAHDEEQAEGRARILLQSLDGHTNARVSEWLAHTTGFPGVGS